ncbi:hypothetical protein KDK_60690 [Dictyobacter kobayashii]|uniref:Uncharacterized protein n=1 Tax=Dictyobacter kobayashii TaxID=2014872 RepID=A0A402AT67_9CHLR|nr:hypothetical protein KDK_60690 [Dictyobacter kobayashii]
MAEANYLWAKVKGANDWLSQPIGGLLLLWIGLLARTRQYKPLLVPFAPRVEMEQEAEGVAFFKGVL